MRGNLRDNGREGGSGSRLGDIGRSLTCSFQLHSEAKQQGGLFEQALAEDEAEGGESGGGIGGIKKFKSAPLDRVDDFAASYRVISHLHNLSSASVFL